MSQGLYLLLSPCFVSASLWLGSFLRQPFPLWYPDCGVQLLSARLGGGRCLRLFSPASFKSHRLRGPGLLALWPGEAIPYLTRVGHGPTCGAGRLSELHPNTAVGCGWRLVPCRNEACHWKNRELGLTGHPMNHWLLWCHHWEVTHGLIAQNMLCAGARTCSRPGGLSSCQATLALALGTPSNSICRRCFTHSFHVWILFARL